MPRSSGRFSCGIGIIGRKLVDLRLRLMDSHVNGQKALRMMDCVPHGAGQGGLIMLLGRAGRIDNAFG